ncbi:hypothetical protein HZS_2448 [Henneguya salminicola]|nr:hypothetical protein HZS_2448 [Henneguya salminicola]
MSIEAIWNRYTAPFYIDFHGQQKAITLFRQIMILGTVSFFLILSIALGYFLQNMFISLCTIFVATALCLLVN